MSTRSPSSFSLSWAMRFAAGHEARDVYRMAEEVVDYGADATFLS